MKPVYSLTTAIFCVLLLIGSYQTKAQMVGPDVFLQGRYVELGITLQGSYGASSSPSGYHDHCGGMIGTGGPLGFVTDPGMDGWLVGSPCMMGDYFYPGYPFEGWEIQSGPLRHQEFNPGGTSCGANVAYSSVAGISTATWQGTFDSIDIKQETILDTNSLYFMIKVTFTNTASAPKNNIYYMRTLDPDNDLTWPGGSYTTTNLIDHQVTDTTVVSATGGSISAPYLALGTTDTASTALIYAGWPLTITQDLADLYNQTYTPAIYTQGTSLTADQAIGLVTYIAHLASVDSAGDSVFRTTAPVHLHPANQATVTFFYAFSKPAVDSAINHINGVTTPPPSLAVNNVTATTDIKVYPNPSKDWVNVTNLNATDRLSLYDVMGKTITQNWQVTHQGINTFSTGNIPAGAYILLVTDEHGNVRSRVPVRKM